MKKLFTLQGVLNRLRPPATKLIVISEQRVGSRWVLHLLADTYSMQVSPEYSRGQHYGPQRDKVLQEIRRRLSHNIIVKLHHVTPGEVFGNLFPIDYKVIGIVRNPRDRGVSVAFHHKHDTDYSNWPQRGMSDHQAVRYTILQYPRYPISNARQLDIMVPGYSTKRWQPNNALPFIWTSYEWLTETPAQEIEKIVQFIGAEPRVPLDATIESHSFSKRTGRPQGTERRDNVRKRKGIVGDWCNWFDDEMVAATADIQDAYYDRLKSECDVNALLDHAVFDRPALQQVEATDVRLSG